MADFFSDNFTSTGISQASADKNHRTQYYGQQLRWTRSKVTGLFLTTDVVHFARFPSNTRIVEMYITGDDAASAGALNLGLHKDSGTVIDADLFGSAIAKGAARVDALVEATTIASINRGDYLWEMAALGAGSYTKDPQELWQITGVPSTSFTVAVQTFVLEVWYIEP